MTLRTSDNLGKIRLHRFWINISIDVQDRTNFQFPTATGEYQTTTKTKSNTIVRIGSANHDNSKWSKVRNVFVSCSRPCYIKKPDKQPIYATLLLTATLPSSQLQRQDQALLKPSISLQMIKRLPPFSLQIQPAPKLWIWLRPTTSLYFRSFIRWSVWRLGSLLSLVRDS